MMASRRRPTEPNVNDYKVEIGTYIKSGWGVSLLPILLMQAALLTKQLPAG